MLRVILTGFLDSLQDNRSSHSNYISENDITLNILHNDLYIPSFKQALRDGTLLTVCDGTYLPNAKIGAAAWIVEETSSDT